MHERVSVPVVDRSALQRLRRAAGGPLLALATLLLVAVLGEIGLRTFLPRSRVLDPNRDAYWKVRFQEALSLSRSPGSDRLKHVRFDPVLGWAPRPHVQRAERGESTNSRGLRGTAEFTYQRTPGKVRWVALGDSFTYGLGVRDEDLWTEQIARTLGWEIVNLGVNGFGTDQQVLSWVVEGVKYQPDGVVLAFYLPDFHRNSLSFRELPKPRFSLFAGGLSLEAVRIRDAGEIMKESQQVSLGRFWLVDALAFARVRLLGEPLGKFREKEELAERLLVLLARSVRAAGAELRVVIIPHHHFGRFERARDIEAILERVAGSLEVPLLNLTDVLDTGSEAADSLYDPVHQHWTATGHRIASARIATFLREPEGNGVGNSALPVRQPQAQVADRLGDGG